MTFADQSTKSVAKHRVIVEIDIGLNNEQWVNNGAGIWAVNPGNSYPWVDSSLLDGFTAQGFRPIGSVKAGGASLQHGTSVEDLTDTPNAWYLDTATSTLWVTMPNFDEPAMHTVSIGQVFSYSRGAFRPIGGPVPVEGRLVNTPAPSESRDPLFFGRFRYPAISIQLQNGDGEFDLWGRDVDIYGNDCRVLVGAEDLSYSEYLKVYTGFMQAITVDEETASISVSDKRKQLTKPITYATTNTNALTAIEEILAEAYSYTFDSTFYDLTAWNIAKALVGNITLDYQEPAAVIDVIEYITASVFGEFRVDADGLFSFVVVDENATIETLIQAVDILEPHSVDYDPTTVVSSVKVGYARDWEAASGDQYTYYTDDSREATVFATYKTYEEKTFDTALIDEAAAIAFATRVLDYVDTVRGTEQITVPLEFYQLTLGQQIGAIIQRGTQPMLGERKAEIISIDYALDTPTMQLGIRHGGVTEAVRQTEDIWPETAVRYALDGLSHTTEVLDSSGNGHHATKVGYGPVARYQLTTDESDSSGNGNDATLSGGTSDPTFSEDGAQFDGSNDHIILPAAVYGLINEAAAWSVAVRVKLDTLTPVELYGYVFSFEDDNTNAAFIRFFDGGGGAPVWQVRAFNNTGAFTLANPTTDLTDLLLTFDGTTLSIYQDGLLADTDASITTTGIVADAGTIGGDASTPAASNFDGLIKEMRFYDYALSVAEAAAQHERHMSAYEAVEGIAAQALHFNGIDQHVVIPSGLPSGDISVSLWFKLPVNPPTSIAVLFQQDSAAGLRKIYIQTSTGRIVWGSRRANGATEVISTVPGGSWTAGQFHHIVAVQDGLTTLVYLDGALINSDAHADIYTTFSATGYIGSQGAAYWTTGVEDEVRIYSRALDPSEVTALHDDPETGVSASTRLTEDNAIRMVG